MDFALKSSFTNIRQDISRHEELLASMKSRLAEQDALIKQLTDKVALLKKKDSEIAAPVPEMDNPNDKEAFVRRSFSVNERSLGVRQSPDRLSEQNLQILRKIMLIQIEGNKRCISMRELASEVYPTKEYARIKLITR